MEYYRDSYIWLHISQGDQLSKLKTKWFHATGYS